MVETESVQKLSAVRYRPPFRNERSQRTERLGTLQLRTHFIKLRKYQQSGKMYAFILLATFGKFWITVPIVSEIIFWINEL